VFDNCGDSLSSISQSFACPFAGFAHTIFERVSMFAEGIYFGMPTCPSAAFTRLENIIDA
jgi:hypothetical protein